VIHIPVAASQEYVNTYLTCRLSRRLLVNPKLGPSHEHGNDSVLHRAVEPDSLIAVCRHFSRFAN